LSDHTPVIRYVQLAERPRAVGVTLPLRVLVIRPGPADCPGLDLTAEWAQVAEALGDLTRAGLLAITELAAPTQGELRKALSRESFHADSNVIQRIDPPCLSVYQAAPGALYVR
jgi:hypothetical protein